MSSFEHLWFPFTCTEDLRIFPPLTIERGEGMYVYDTQDRRYLDAVGSWWVSVLGHNHPRISSAIKAQIDKIEHVLMAGCIARTTAELTERLSEIAPKNLTRTFYSDNGSTSVEIGLKIALQYWAIRGEKRTDFVSFTGGYHGDTLGAMSVGGIPSYHSLFHDRFKKQLFAQGPYCYRCPCGKVKETCEAQCMDSLEEILRRQCATVAACIFEPMVQGAAGMRVYPAKVLERIFTLCEKYEVLTIADEVAMGFGRTGTMFACEHAARSPDIMCLAKGLTGGYLPMAVTLVSEGIYREFSGDFLSGREFQHGHTFTGNPLAASAARETLALFKELGIPSSLQSIGAYFRKELCRFDEFEIVGDIRCIGTVGALELVADRKTKANLDARKRIPMRIAHKARDYGILMRPLGDVIYFIPAYCISEEQIDEMFEGTRRAIQDVVYS